MRDHYVKVLEALGLAPGDSDQAAIKQLVDVTDAIFAEGVEEGYALGHEAGVDDGFSEGQDSGYADGYDIGYADGVEEGD